MLARFPTQPTRFVGRVRELAEIAERLVDPDCRLLTLTGGGGSGKTRLAVEACQAAAPAFADGALFVALQPVDETDLLVPTIAHAADFSFYRPDDVQTQLFDYLHDRSMILLLDNFEHLLDGAGLIGEILTHAPGVKIVITSREALNLQEEWLYPVRGMDMPHSVYSTALEDYEAVQLFVDLARRVQPSFNLAEAREAVARIVQISGGLPLAIELAASWLKGLSVVDIAREMQHNLDFLSTTTRNVEGRHRSIRAAFDQSWKLLGDDERMTFARLSVFRGGFERDAAEEVAGASLPTLAALAEKSLLNPQPGGRWDVHELLRQYGEEKLAEMDMAQDARTAHSRYYAGFMRRREPGLKGPSQLAIMDEIERDYENLRLAWDWAIHLHLSDVLDQMLDSLYHLGFARNRYRETVVMFVHALVHPLDDRLRGRLLVRRWGTLHWLIGIDYDKALDALGQALAIAEAAGDRFEIAFCQLMLGYVGLNTQENSWAREVLSQGLALFHELNEPFYECWVMNRIGLAYFHDLDIEQGIAWAEKGLALARSAPNQYTLGNCLYNLAEACLLSGDYDKGKQCAEEAVQVVRSVGHHGQIAHAIALLALAHFLRGEFDEAQRRAEEARRLGEDAYAPPYQLYPLTLLILLSCMDEDYEEAARLAELIDSQAEIDSMAFQLLNWTRSVLACGKGDLPEARRSLQESLHLALKGRCLAIEIALLPGAAFVLAETKPAQAARLLAWFDVSADRATLWARRWPLLKRLHGELSERLGEAAFEAECERGAALTWPEALSALAAEFDAQVPGPPLPLIDEPLTQRELEVLNLLAAGLTNSEIADRLVIGVGTVKTHAQNIYGKLEVGNRTQAIVRARELGLLP